MARRSKNLSVSQFQDLMAKIPKVVADELVSEVRIAGEELADAMRPAVPRGIDGRHELVESVRVEQGDRPLKVLIKAGGPTTMRQVRQGAGVTYDYSIAIEFGTENMSAQPFFWPTYRLKKRPLRARLNRRAKKAIEKVVKLK